MEKKVLGKGLDALIPKKNMLETAKDYVHLPMYKISPGRYQPRKEMNTKELEELARSIKEKGIIQPIIVRKTGEESYEIVAGGRRYHAAKSLGLNEIPTIIKELDDKNALIYAIVENLQRQDLNPIDEAESFQQLIEQFEFTLEDVAQVVGKDKTTIANTLRLQRLLPEIKEAVRKRIITRSQARTILGMETEEAQRKLFRDILSEGLSVREIETRVQRASKKRKSVDPFVLEVEDTLQKSLGTKVRVFHKRNNRGKIAIEYYSLEDLERITKRLG
ncbi:MAG: ParB/RepB/Spo0J family partition protein [Candidatus Omnitrophota bacterium]